MTHHRMGHSAQFLAYLTTVSLQTAGKPITRANSELLNFYVNIYFFNEYMPLLSFIYCIFQSHFVYSFQYFLLSTFSTRWRRPFNWTLYSSEPSSFFICLFSAIHRQTCSAMNSDCRPR